MTDGVTAAIIAASAALVGVIVNGFFTYRSFKKQKEIEKFKIDMQIEMSRNNALTSYQYEARKRLYTECEPVFFQLSEASELAYKSCINLGKKKFCAELRQERDNLDKNYSIWMLTKSSGLISTLYALLHPIALYCILREKMTFVDCSLDNIVSFRYQMARYLLLSFHEDAEIAALAPAIDYNPIVEDWRKRRLEMPTKYWWQGATPGRLDKAVRMLIVNEGGSRRVISFGEFEDLYINVYNGSDRDTQKTLGVAANALYGFTPFDRPVFWRMILIHAHLYNALSKQTPNNINSIINSQEMLRVYIQLPDKNIFDWTKDHGWNLAELKNDDAEQVALDYLVRRLSVTA